MKQKIKKLLFVMTIIAAVLGCSLNTSAKYYSYSQVGMSGIRSNSSLYHVASVSKKKLTYQKVIFKDNPNYVEYKFGKKMTAKITSKTKFYIGNPERYGKKMYTASDYRKIKWIKRVNFSKFKAEVNTEAQKRAWWDYVKVKNGKVVAVFINMQIAN